MTAAMTILTRHDQLQLARIPLLSGLPDPVRATVLDRSSVLSLSRGETLFVQGDAADRLFIVLEGWIKVFRLTAEGGQTVLHIFRAGESFAEPAVFGLGRYPASAEAAADSRLLAVPGSALKTALEQDSSLALKLIGVFAQRLNAMVAETERRQFLSTPLRVAAFLLDLVKADPDLARETGEISLRLPYDKALIAARLGMTPESFSRALAKLKDMGVDAQGATITIPSAKDLADALETGI